MQENIFVLSNGENIPVIISSKRGLRNITLRPKTIPKREIYISVPWLTSVSAGVRFMEQKRLWIEKIFNKTPEKSHISDGDIINLFGENILIKQDSLKKSDSYLIDGTGQHVLVIGGSPEMLERRVRDFIKKEFLLKLKEIIRTAPVEFRPKKIAIRDTSSRWGSCSSSGTISFSWRLAFAPPEIMRYVVMHELAHIRYMDHSPAFWAQVAHLYGDGVGRAKLWLSKHGSELHKYL